MHRWQKYWYFMKIDLLMQYCTFMIDNELAQFVIIVT
jgi:hypothetical protein